MNNHGIEIIIEKILADAQSEADSLIADAQSEADKVLAESTAKADSISAGYRARAEQIASAGAQAAQTAGENRARAALLEAKSAIIDEAFESARAKICALDEESYFAFLSSLLFSALDDRADAVKTSDETGDEICRSDEYVLLLNAADREKYADKLIKSAKEKYPDISLTPDNSDTPIDGGLILKGGDLEVCCSVSVLVERTRERTEREVASRLFGTDPENHI